MKHEKEINLSSHKSFYFEEHEIPKYLRKAKSSEVKLSLNRISFVFFIFLVVASVFGIKIIYLAFINKANFFANTVVQKPFLNRQDILDRNNNLLAKNVRIFSVAIKPELIKDKEKLLLKLKLNFPSLDIDHIKKKIEKSNFF